MIAPRALSSDQEYERSEFRQNEQSEFHESKLLGKR